MVAPGDVLAGKYRVERVLGQGGMGVVVAAHHLQLDEKVALKFLLPGAHGPETDARFLREAQAAVKIKSEHVARVIDVGRLDDGVPYMVMEYLDGGDLAAWLAQQGAMTVEQAVDFVLQACEAIAEAHALGIVHRDLKPSNLFCIRRPDGQLSIKVLDFGISKMTAPGAAAHDVTSTTTIVGSPTYMSPEQLQSSKSVDARADVWSLGVILFELLTTRLPFDSESITDLVIRIATAPAIPLASLRPDLPPGFDAVVSRCLEKDRGARFASVAELASALEPFGSRHAHGSVERIHGILRGSSPMPVAGPSPSIPDAGARPPTVVTWGKTGAGQGARPQSKALLLGGGLAAAAVAGIVAILFVHARTGAAPPAASEPVATASAAPTPSDSLTPLSDPAAVAAPSSSSSPSPLGLSAASPSSAPPTTAWHTTRGPLPARPSHAANPACDPPYTLDDQGRKHFKPQCYLGK